MRHVNVEADALRLHIVNSTFRHILYSSPTVTPDKDTPLFYRSILGFFDLLYNRLEACKAYVLHFTVTPM